MSTQMYANIHFRSQVLGEAKAGRGMGGGEGGGGGGGGGGNQVKSQCAS